MNPRTTSYEVYRPGRVASSRSPDDRRGERRVRRGPSEAPTAAYAVVREDRRRASTTSDEIYRPGGGLVGVEEPDDGQITLWRRVHHDARSWMFRVRGVHDDRLSGRRCWKEDLPQGERRDDRSGEDASERQSGMAQPTSTLPRLTHRHRRALPLPLDAAHDPRPEPGPVGGNGGREGLAQCAPEFAEAVDLGLTANASGKVGRRRPSRPGIQGAVEVGPKAPPRAETGQHIDWTGQQPLAILSGI